MPPGKEGERQKIATLGRWIAQFIAPPHIDDSDGKGRDALLEKAIF
jgi:hypothetical protein